MMDDAPLLRGALLSGLCSLSACACDELPPPPDASESDDRLVLLAGRFLDTERVELVFSDPLAPVDGVDPQKFRLSIAQHQHYDRSGRCESDTEYCELSLGLEDRGCARCGYTYYGRDDEDCPEPTIVDALTIDPDDATRLHLHISPPIRPLLCSQIEFAGPSVNIIAHYSAFDVPTITDQRGRSLESIAPHWVLSDETRAFRDASFPALDSLAPIPCPEDAG